MERRVDKTPQYGFLLQKILSEIRNIKKESLDRGVAELTTAEPSIPIELFYQKIQQLFETELDSIGAMRHRNSKVSQFVKTIHQLIDENISNPNLSIGALCKAVHLERTQVYRKLKAEIGLSPTDLITKKRMEHASRLLIHSENTIGEVAAKSGYHELSYFDKVFLKYYGFTPTEFRKNQSEKPLVTDENF